MMAAGRKVGRLVTVTVARQKSDPRRWFAMNETGVMRASRQPTAAAETARCQLTHDNTFFPSQESLARSGANSTEFLGALSASQLSGGAIVPARSFSGSIELGPSFAGNESAHSSNDPREAKHRRLD